MSDHHMPAAHSLINIPAALVEKVDCMGIAARQLFLDGIDVLLGELLAMPSNVNFHTFQKKIKMPSPSVPAWMPSRISMIFMQIDGKSINFVGASKLTWRANSRWKPLYLQPGGGLGLLDHLPRGQRLLRDVRLLLHCFTAAPGPACGVNLLKELSSKSLFFSLPLAEPPERDF
mgnify:CR=1 FL=1